MFICPKCKAKMDLPECNCGYVVKKKSSIWQLSDMPDIVTDGVGDKYIGYEYIGMNYSGNRKYLIEDKDTTFAKEISEITGNGIFLDLACGDGCFTVPCAKNGTRIVAGDISNSMLSILMKKAEHNHISLDNVTLCRMNALDIPLSEESVDTVVANSVLHLISNPEKVVLEIHRVLKKGGCFVCIDDSPGRTSDTCFDNTNYNRIVNWLYSEYWAKMKENHLTPQKYSWKFDRETVCKKVFSEVSSKVIERNRRYEIPLKDGFLPRFTSRGFSDQVDIPDELHNCVIKELLSKCSEKFGEEFAETTFKGAEDDLLMTIYVK